MRYSFYTFLNMQWGKGLAAHIFRLKMNAKAGHASTITKYTLQRECLAVLRLVSYMHSHVPLAKTSHLHTGLSHLTGGHM